MAIITGTDGVIQGKVNSGGLFNNTQLTECCRQDVTEDTDKLFAWCVYCQHINTTLLIISEIIFKLFFHFLNAVSLDEILAVEHTFCVSKMC